MATEVNEKVVNMPTNIAPPAQVEARQEAEKKPRKRYNRSESYEYLKPVYIRKLTETMTLQAVGDLIGCSGSTLSTALKKESIQKVYEVAAEGVYDRLNAPEPEIIPMAVITLAITKESLPSMEEWLNNAKIPYTVFSK